MLVYEPKFEDFLGKKFNKLTVLALLARKHDEDGRVSKVEGKNYPQPTQYLCRCDCGNLTIVGRQSLSAGSTHSCGCVPAGRPKGRKNFNFNIPIATRGCRMQNPPCSKMIRMCCWDCDDYENCKIACTKNPSKCGVYKG